MRLFLQELKARACATSEGAVAGVLSLLIGSSSGSCIVDASHLRSRVRVRLTGPDFRTRHRILLVTIPDTEVERRVVFLVSTGEFDRRSGGSIATTDNLDLSAAKDSVSIY